MWVWIVLALTIVAALAGYAVYLQTVLKKRDAQRAVWRREVEELLEARTDKITTSITVIAGAMLEQQMSLSECVLRLSSLLNQLGPVGAEDRFQTLHKAAQELDHIPILEEWAQLKFRERMKFQKEMDAVEGKYGDFVLEICRSLQRYGLQTPPQQGVGHFQP